MTSYHLTEERLSAYTRYLHAEERSPGTIEKYRRDTEAFCRWLSGAPVTREQIAAWKAFLLSQHYAPTTITSMLAALNGLFRFLGWDECRARFLKVQRRLFRDASRELTRVEYDRLLEAARARGQERLVLLMETICATGIRVSEVKYITVQAALQGRADIFLKGKIRTILLPGKLCRKLLSWARAQKITSGELFVTRTGRGLTRGQIWSEMKSLCAAAAVEPGKVFPHNLRHLFARAFYRVSRDIARLADVLGHSSIETTRIYLLTTSAEHERTLERLNLVS